MATPGAEQPIYGLFATCMFQRLPSWGVRSLPRVERTAALSLSMRRVSLFGKRQLPFARDPKTLLPPDNTAGIYPPYPPPTALFRQGVSQKDCTSYYGFLEEEAGRLSGLLKEFFEEEVCNKFADPDCEFKRLLMVLRSTADVSCLFVFVRYTCRRLASQGTGRRTGFVVLLLIA